MLVEGRGLSTAVTPGSLVLESSLFSNICRRSAVLVGICTVATFTMCLPRDNRMQLMGDKTGVICLTGHVWKGDGIISGLAQKRRGRRAYHISNC